MNDVARTKLCEIVAAAGADLPTETERLRDFLASIPEDRERFLLMAAWEHGAAELRDQPAEILDSARQKAVERLTGELPIILDFAQWAVDSWAVAFGITLPDLPPCRPMPPPAPDTVPIRQDEAAAPFVPVVAAPVDPVAPATPAPPVPPFASAPIGPVPYRLPAFGALREGAVGGAIVGAAASAVCVPLLWFPAGDWTEGFLNASLGAVVGLGAGAIVGFVFTAGSALLSLSHVEKALIALTGCALIAPVIVQAILSLGGNFWAVLFGTLLPSIFIVLPFFGWQCERPIAPFATSLVAAALALLSFGLIGEKSTWRMGAALGGAAIGLVLGKVVGKGERLGGHTAWLAGGAVGWFLGWWLGMTVLAMFWAPLAGASIGLVVLAPLTAFVTKHWPWWKPRRLAAGALVAGFAFLLWWTHYLSGNEIVRFRGHSGEVLSVTLAPNGRDAASGGTDGTVRVWDVVTCQELTRLDVGAGAVTCLAFSPDSRYLAAGYGLGIINDKHNARHENLLSTMVASAAPLAPVAIGGSAPASPPQDPAPVVQDALRIWDLTTGQEAVRFKNMLEMRFQSVAFSPDGRQLVTASLNMLILWECSSGKEIRRFEGHKGLITTSAFSPDGRFLISGGLDKTVRFWDASSGKATWIWEHGTSPVVNVAWTADGSRAMAACLDGWVMSYHPSFKRLLQSFAAPEEIYAAAFSPDGRRALTFDRTGGMVRLWDTTTGRALKHHLDLRDIDTPIWRAGCPGAVAPRHGLALSVGQGSSVRVWTLAE